MQVVHNTKVPFIAEHSIVFCFLSIFHLCVSVCLSHCYTLVKKHHDQVNYYFFKSKIKIDYWGLAYSLEVCYIIIMVGSQQHAEGYGTTAETYILVHRQREIQGLSWAIETTKPTPSNPLPSTRPQLLISSNPFK